MDRNLGASRVATSLTDPEAYGDLYQWGRGTDGHEKRTSSTTSTLSPTDVPDHDSFVLPSNSPYDWITPQNPNLWQGASGTNNPCPSGFRLPTQTEFIAELNESGISNSADAFASPLKLVNAGLHNCGNGSVYTMQAFSVTTGPVRWMAEKSCYLSFYSDSAYIDGGIRAQGYSVRCLKD